jgi:hypothetical protein
MIPAAFVVASILTTTMLAPAGDSPLPDGRCDHCGSCTGVRRQCVVKEVVREKKKVCWDAECVPHCIPGPSEHCGTACGRDECGCYTYDLWKPTCARVAMKTVPVRREVTRKVPGLEWTVEERCDACRRGARNCHD